MIGMIAAESTNLVIFIIDLIKERLNLRTVVKETWGVWL